ncbi:tachykinin-like peptides receptor 99D [Artemia franciscana]|uniref:tachykinin-like peptides receptor 99D n=1 Tax=Artemia franciscana TaxID=6661 RepID=UPI0032DB9F03
MTFTYPWWHQLLCSVAALIIVAIATGGNLIVVYIVLSDRRMRTVTNFLLVNLAIADCLNSIFNGGFNTNYLVTQDWIFGEYFCKFCQFMAVLCMVGSILTLMAISVERYFAIVHPLRPRMTEKTTVCVATGIWFFSTLLSLPYLIFSYTYTDERTTCYLEWPDSPENDTDLQAHFTISEQVYNATFMFSTYVVPLIIISYAYARVGIELWGSHIVGEATPHQLESLQAKRKVVKMMLVVVFIFIVCWLPFQVYFLLVPQHSSATRNPYIQHIFLPIWFLALSNSMYNPFIYCWMNARFRKGFTKVFRFCLPSCWRKRSSLQIYRYSCSSPDTRVFRNGSARLQINQITISGWSRNNSSRRTLTTLAPESRYTSPLSIHNRRLRSNHNENEGEEIVEIPMAELVEKKAP